MGHNNYSKKIHLVQDTQSARKIELNDLLIDSIVAQVRCEHLFRSDPYGAFSECLITSIDGRDGAQTPASFMWE